MTDSTAFMRAKIAAAHVDMQMACQDWADGGTLDEMDREKLRWITAYAQEILKGARPTSDTPAMDAVGNVYKRIKG